MFSQTPEGGKQDQSEVLRVFTELVQTDVMVFDREGHFINGLKKEDFELRIDGQPKPIDFFERIISGSANEETQLAAARGSSNRTNKPDAAPVPLDRGRPIFFYLDDLHMDLASLNAAKKTVSEFIDKQMGQNDEVAISSSSGQIGFLQQLTDNKAVLHAALERVKFRPYTGRDFDRPPMGEYQALQIERYDHDVTEYFIAQVLAQNPMMTREAAEAEVRGRARMLLQQAESVTMATISGLDDLVRSANKLAGRKLVFLISGGFFLNPQASSMSRVQRITSLAARNGVVIYSIDARGLATGLADAATDRGFDITGTLERAAMGEMAASQDAMNALARDTGGKPTFNTNALGVGLAKALKETSAYYLLAWKPEGETQHASSKFHKIEVKVIGRPQLVVQVRRGFFDVEPEPAVAKSNKPKQPDANKPAEANKLPESDLRNKLGGTFPERGIPISLNLTYLNTSDRGWLLTTMMEVPSAFLTFENVGGKQVATVEVAGVFFNDRGQPGGSFTKNITLEAQPDYVSGRGSVRYSYPLFLPQGLYHVRVAARDPKSGRIGSAHDWIEIPTLKPTQLGISSVLIGLRPAAAVGSNSESSQTMASSLEVNIGHRFQRNSNLRFALFVYNSIAAPAPDSKPDLALQLLMVRDEQPVVTTPLKKISTNGITDLSRIPYAGEVPLAGLPAGRYLLKVTVIDRISKQSASQEARFEIE
ncbi:MAG: VWA domain-containing protein [bacterium]